MAKNNVKKAQVAKLAPRGKPFTTETGREAGKKSKRPPLDKRWREILEKEKNGVADIDEILLSLKTEALKGNVQATRELLNRAYGQAKQSIEHSGADGEPIENKLIIEFVDVD